MMTEKNLGLLQFLTPLEEPERILVVEASEYLPELKKRYPSAELYAVSENMEELASAGVIAEIHCLDYTAVPLPFERSFFDIIIAPHFLETVINPQDIASGFGLFIKPTGFLLTSFSNIRFWRVLDLLADGYYQAVVRRFFARPNFETLLLASFYKEIFFVPAQKEPMPQELLSRLTAAGFCGADDMETKEWFVQAWRSTRSVARLKARYTPEIRRCFVKLCRRMEYGIDISENGMRLRQLCLEEKISPLYFAAFTRETIVYKKFFREALVTCGGFDDMVLFLNEEWENAHDA